MRTLVIFSVFCFQIHLGFGQVIINGQSTPISSAFTINGSDKGVLLPKISLTSVSTTQLDGVNTAADGLLIYNTNASVIGGDGIGFYMYNGTSAIWEKVISPKSSIGVVPIGSIIAWHDRVDFPYLTLPEGWQLCDGSTIIDSESPLNGLATPDLISSTTSTSGRTSQGHFLRGGSVSGVFQVDQTNNLQSITSATSSGGSPNLLLNETGTTGYLTTDRISGTFGSERYGLLMRGYETRAVNMSVKWIIRIK